ncbi:MAG: T9SS type A sorting domain-containing protein [Bacteroidales bacterium]|nr:T9SS type A sorting domain-containing protein [Bacteroidales bacterium]
MRKRTVLQLLLLAGMLLVPFAGRSQNAEVHFTYDACGNRILKSLQLRKIEENGKNVEDRNVFLATATENIQDLKVDLYPNPTEGKFVVTLSDNTHTIMEAILTTASGVVMEHHRFMDFRHEFDLSQQPAGIYLLKLIYKDETRTWKIVKY